MTTVNNLTDEQNDDYLELEVRSAPKLRTPQLHLKGLPKSGKGWKKNSAKS